jgi:hypothetical protein
MNTGTEGTAWSCPAKAPTGYVNPCEATTGDVNVDGPVE